MKRRNVSNPHKFFVYLILLKAFLHKAEKSMAYFFSTNQILAEWEKVELDPTCFNPPQIWLAKKIPSRSFPPSGEQPAPVFPKVNHPPIFFPKDFWNIEIFPGELSNLGRGHWDGGLCKIQSALLNKLSNKITNKDWWKIVNILHKSSIVLLTYTFL